MNKILAYTVIAILLGSVTMVVPLALLGPNNLVPADTTNTYSGSGNGKWIFIGQSGTFQGAITGSVLNGTISGQFVGHGTENFDGQKIKGTFEGSANSIKAEITIKATITAKTNTIS